MNYSIYCMQNKNIQTYHLIWCIGVCVFLLLSRRHYMLYVDEQSLTLTSFEPEDKLNTKRTRKDSAVTFSVCVCVTPPFSFR